MASWPSSDSEKYLTEDIWIDIFCRVDVESILRCTSVCKTWHHAIINDASFVKNHLTCQKTSSNANKYVLHYNFEWCKLLADYELLFDSTKHSKLHYTPKLFEKNIDTCDGDYHMKIHGTCDGLLCFSSEADENKIRYIQKEYYRVGDNLYLWNPVCRRAKKLPQLRISEKPVCRGDIRLSGLKCKEPLIRNGGVSFGSYGDDYKVIVISSSRGREYIVSVYSLSSDCWNNFHTECYYEEVLDFCIIHPTKFVDGIAYMITASRRTSVSKPPVTLWFDLRDETIRTLKCPQEFVEYGACYAIEAYGETIAVLGCSSRHLALWTLIRDEVSYTSRWEKKHVIELQQVNVYSYVPVGFLYNGKYMISRDMITTSPQLLRTTFLLCDLESLDVTEYRSQNDSEYLCSIIIPNCVESLLLLDEDSVDPFVHSEMESSCSSILFTLQKGILYLQ